MQILIYLHSLSSGGAERVVSELANCWASVGTAVTIVTIAPVKSDFFVLHANVERVSLDLDVESRSILGALRNNWRRIRSLRRVLRRGPPDIAIGFMCTANCALYFAALGTSVPVVGCERTYPPSEPLGRPWKVLRWLIYRYLDAVVAQTHTTAEWLERSCAPRRVAVIPNMITLPLRPLEPPVPVSLHVPSEFKLLLAVGRLSVEKGFNTLVEAFGKLASSERNWILCILGEGRDRATLERLVYDLGLQDRVVMPGIVGNVGDWYEAADLFALTSVFEGFPNALLEAMAHGVPAVTVDCDTGPRDIVRDGVDGVLVPRNDLDAFVEALRCMMTDDRLRCECGANARDVQQRFSLSRIAGQWRDLFDEVI